jgi:hypothetical protein
MYIFDKEEIIQGNEWLLCILDTFFRITARKEANDFISIVLDFGMSVEKIKFTKISRETSPYILR